MSAIRHLFTARTARPKLEASMRAMVDDVRDVVARSVGIEHVDEYAKVTMLLDDARAAVKALAVEGRPAFVEGLAKVLEGDFRRDALKVALDVVRADGTVSPAEQRALDELAGALGLQPSDLAR